MRFVLHSPCCGLFRGRRSWGKKCPAAPIALEPIKDIQGFSATYTFHDGNIHERLWILSYCLTDILGKTEGTQSWQQGFVWSRRFPTKLKCDIQNGLLPLTHSCQLKGGALGNFIWIVCQGPGAPLLRDKRLANTQQVCWGSGNATEVSRNCLKLWFQPVVQGKGWQTQKRVYKKISQSSRALRNFLGCEFSAPGCNSNSQSPLLFSKLTVPF